LAIFDSPSPQWGIGVNIALQCCRGYSNPSAGTILSTDDYCNLSAILNS